MGDLKIALKLKVWSAVLNGSVFSLHDSFPPVVATRRGGHRNIVLLFMSIVACLRVMRWACFSVKPHYVIICPFGVAQGAAESSVSVRSFADDAAMETQRVRASTAAIIITLSSAVVVTEEFASLFGQRPVIGLITWV